MSRILPTGVNILDIYPQVKVWVQDIDRKDQNGPFPEDLNNHKITAKDDLGLFEAKFGERFQTKSEYCSSLGQESTDFTTFYIKLELIKSIVEVNSPYKVR